MVTFDQLMLPLIKALVNLGGSGSIDEIYEAVVELEKFDEDTLAVLHNPEKSSQTEVGYRLAWARTYLKKAGYLENSSRGVWALTDKARQEPEIDSREIVNFVEIWTASLNRLMLRHLLQNCRPMTPQKRLCFGVKNCIMC